MQGLNGYIRTHLHLGRLVMDLPLHTLASYFTYLLLLL